MIYHTEPSCQELLQRAASCYATAAKLAPGDVKAHLGLALIMEELFYAEDICGIKKEVGTLVCMIIPMNAL